MLNLQIGTSKFIFFTTLFLIWFLFPVNNFASDSAQQTEVIEQQAWWLYPLILLVLSFLLGVFAVLAGVGGGVLYVPIVSGFLPFHLDFVRGAGLIVALAGALAAGPGLLRKGFANLRLAIPMALIASSSAIVGAMIGLALPTDIIQTLLGATILGIVVLMIKAKKSVFPEVPNQIVYPRH